jgi:hypothetical protein
VAEMMMAMISNPHVVKRRHCRIPVRGIRN